jgi:hypothetical protein
MKKLLGIALFALSAGALRAQTPPPNLVGPITAWEYSGCVENWFCSSVFVTKQRLTDRGIFDTWVKVFAYSNPPVGDYRWSESMKVGPAGSQEFREGWVLNSLSNPVGGANFWSGLPTSFFDIWSPNLALAVRRFDIPSGSVTTGLMPMVFIGSAVYQNEADIPMGFRVVPEPSSYAMMAVGLAGIVATRRRRRAVRG